jgi:hypothetical protein
VDTTLARSLSASVSKDNFIRETLLVFRVMSHNWAQSQRLLIESSDMQWSAPGASQEVAEEMETLLAM